MRSSLFRAPASGSGYQSTWVVTESIFDGLLRISAVLCSPAISAIGLFETLLRVGVAPLESPGCGNGQDQSENSLARFTHSPSGASR